MVTYYASYVPVFAKLAAPLTEKLKVGREEGKKGSKTPIVWDDEQLEAFKALKTALTHTVPLQSAQPDRPYVLRCDAGDYAIGAVLEQLPPTDTKDADLSERKKTERCTRPVAFMSRKLTGGQKKWSVREKEAYAIVSDLQKCSTWVQAQPILVVTDHKSLETWHTEALDTPSGPAGRRARWNEFFHVSGLQSSTKRAPKTYLQIV